MGMFDWVKFEMNCPKCGGKVDGFQTKDLDRSLSVVEINDINNFYAPCDKCGAWIEFDRRPAARSSIADFDMTVAER